MTREFKLFGAFSALFGYFLALFFTRLGDDPSAAIDGVMALCALVLMVRCMIRQSRA